MEKFKLVSAYKPTGDQPQAIEKLTAGSFSGMKHQVLLGVTGSGKTFTIANVIKNINKPILVISHNKTLAAQLYQEYRDFFPHNAVEYFVSYYDYYQPESYIPQTDTYIAKETDINEQIDKLRLSATTSLMTRKDIVVVASVSCIYNLGSPIEYGRRIIELRSGMKLRREDLIKRLTHLYYTRSDYEFKRATFRVKGDTLDVFPAYEDYGLRFVFLDTKLEKIYKINPITGKQEEELELVVIYPAKHYLTADERLINSLQQIRQDLKIRLEELKSQGKQMEAYRLEQRTNYDLEMIGEIGYCNGIENYSRYFDGRESGEPPFTLLDYFPTPKPGFSTDLRPDLFLSRSGLDRVGDWLCIIDESHITVPQIQGMYRGDLSRKQTLIDYGFRLPSALDNRPLRFEEFLQRVPQIIYTSATPGEWEISEAILEANRITQKGPSLFRDGPCKQPVQQLIRPTGLLDPEIEIRGTKNQIENLIDEIIKRVKQKERVLVTTLTKRMAEDLAEYLSEQGIKVHHLHADIDTLDRSDILDDLRLGKYDVVVGINLLREGLDLPEVSLVAILDADREGFLRSATSLIQVMGRASRHVHGNVIMYADEVTSSMHQAIDEVNRRRKVQEKYNKEHNITPQTIKKPIRDKLIEREEEKKPEEKFLPQKLIQEIEEEDNTERLISRLEGQMRQAAKQLEFEKAAFLRDKIRELEETSESR